MKKLFPELFAEKYANRPSGKWLLVLWLGLLLSLSAAVVVTTLIGVYNGWRLLPILDMWNGEVASVLAIENGQASAWWAQHNEHRLLFPRFFFWIDVNAFGATGVFLAISILIVMALIVLAFYRASLVVLRQTATSMKPSLGLVIALLTIVAMNFSWLQYENFLWGFQIQFVLATMLPLVSLLSLERSSHFREVNKAKYWAYFALAIGASTAALLTMASGITAPWILTALGLFLAQPLWRKIFLIAYAALVSGLYLIGYKTPDQHANPLESLTQPLQVIRFVLHYFGGPFEAVSKSSKVGLIFGAIILLLVILAIALAWLRRKESPMRLALAAFMAGVLANALLVALGRINFGVEPTSRYFTPVYSMISALIVVFVPEIQRLASKRVFIPLIAVTLAMVVLAAGQYPSFKRNREASNLQDGIAAVALSLGVSDQDVLGPSQAWPFIYPVPQMAVDYAQQFRTAGVTILSRDPYVNMASSIGTRFTGDTATKSCYVSVSADSPSANSAFNKISGVISGTDAPRKGEALPVINSSFVVIGYVVYGFATDGVPSTNTKFVGYVNNSFMQSGLSISTSTGVCSSSTK